jgi:hypothetical protein
MQEMVNQKKLRSILLLSFFLPLPYAWPVGVQDKQYHNRRHERCMVSNGESTSKESENIYLPFKDQNTCLVTGF